MDLNDRVSKIEGKHEGLDVYLPHLLQRFESMEKDIRADMDRGFSELRHGQEASAWQRWMSTLAVFSLVAAVFSVAAALYFGLVAD